MSPASVGHCAAVVMPAPGASLASEAPDPLAGRLGALASATDAAGAIAGEGVARGDACPFEAACRFDGSRPLAAAQTLARQSGTVSAGLWSTDKGGGVESASSSRGVVSIPRGGVGMWTALLFGLSVEAGGVVW